MIGATPPGPLHNFMAWVGKLYPFHLFERFLKPVSVTGLEIV